ncbi:MAG TPA: GNAT family N-acetyltransferase [Pyrinomonadaceae bacterium]|nr:GNAT family N-acetyltransferase [Pyrinomonadaceae bacterium]
MTQTPPRIIRTERLFLRPPEMTDAEAIFDAYARDTEVTRYLSWRADASVAETREFMRGRLEELKAGKKYAWLITKGEGQAGVGMIDISNDRHKASVGYVLARTEWGKGYMTEALRAVIGAAFTLPQVYRVWAVCDVDNVGSARVLEKAGMIFEGVLKRWTMHPNVSDEPRDVRCYAVTR